MKKYLRRIAACVLVVSTVMGARPLHVVVAYPYIGDLVEKIGGGDVRVFVLARGDYNPHMIIARPSFIAQIRRADLLIISGAQLEIGWMPPLLRQASNPSVQPGEPGFLDLSRFVKLIDVPSSVSREHGDIHPDGNPHYYLDPEYIPLLAKAIQEKLSQLDSQHSSAYEGRYQEFTDLWNHRLVQWASKMNSVKNMRVVEYHKNYDYFLRRYELQIAGTVEPLPGIPPTSKHMEQLESLLRANPARFILQDVYNPDDASIHLADKLGMKVVVMPHDVGSIKEATSIVAMFDELVRRVTE